jgi:hypothetical protein
MGLFCVQGGIAMFIAAVIIFLLIWIGAYRARQGTFHKAVLWTFFIFILAAILGAIGVVPWF